jgi:hypothetical protein
MVDGTPRQLDPPALARRYGRELAAAAHAVLESREAAEAAAAAGIADVLRAHQTATLPETATTLDVLRSATLRRAEAARRRWRQVDPLPDRTTPPATISFAVSAEAVSAALAAAPLDDRQPGRTAWLVAAGVLLIAAVGIGLWLIPADGGRAAVRNPSLLPTPSSPAAAIAVARGPITLAGCRVEPASTPVAYRGWLTLGDLTGADAADAGRPLFALVTAGEAEWLGWHDTGSGAMYPRPVGRVACAIDPFSGTTRAYAVAGDWQPPTLPDACPPGEIYKFGDLREIGGPRLFATLPIGTGSWRAHDAALRLYLRLAAPPNVDTAVTATARSLEADATVPLTVERVLASPAATPVRNLYLTLRNVDLPNPGCWIVSVALDGEVAGSTLVPVSEPARGVSLGR